jgi:SAM-dependent methyltransferase
MIEIAKKNSSHPNIQYFVGDVRDFSSELQVDIVLSLFHVMSYQVENNDLLKTFKTAKTHLKKGGIFIFDCWYGPGVLVDPPKNRIKEVENHELKIYRRTTPVVHESENCVDVIFNIDITDKEQQQQFEISELHKMRYLFIPEIKLLANACGLEFIAFSKWMTHDKPSRGDWYIVNILKKP